MFRVPDCLDMTIVDDWDVKQLLIVHVVDIHVY